MISAKIIKDSISFNDTRIVTLELEYPRIIHSELMTHRVFSRNSASSRAIPVSKVIEMVESNPAMPVHWGKNQAGMQAKEELTGVDLEAVKALWLEAAKQACSIAKIMNTHGAHKQVVNRILEPFQWMKVVVTSTEWSNWDWLRDHDDADPTIHELARKVKSARDNSIPMELDYGDWHLPYVDYGLSKLDGSLIYYDENHNQIPLEQAKMISASCCAQVSYRKADGSLDKAEMIYDKLINSEPVHASPVEHQATPIHSMNYNHSDLWEEGVTHRDFNGDLWSGNFRNWIQNRQLIPNNAKYN